MSEQDELRELLKKVPEQYQCILRPPAVTVAV